MNHSDRLISLDVRYDSEGILSTFPAITGISGLLAGKIAHKIH